MNRTDATKKASSYIKYWGNPNQFTKWYCKDNKTHAWCGMFVDYIFKKDLKSTWLDGCSNFAYVPTIVSWAKKMKYWNTDFKKAKEGDLVIYNWKPTEKHYSHVGIVKQVKSSSIVSIEGNTTNGSRKNCVAKKTRSKKYVAGVVLLPYIEKYNLTRVLKKGCKGDDVKKAQQELTKRGYKCTIDGDYGSKTEAQAKKYQKAKGFSQDGKIGKASAHSFGWLFKGK